MNSVPFGNRSIDYTRVVVNIGLAYEQDLDATLPVMQRIADEWAEEHKIDSQRR